MSFFTTEPCFYILWRLMLDYCESREQLLLECASQGKTQHLVLDKDHPLSNKVIQQLKSLFPNNYVQFDQAFCKSRAIVIGSFLTAALFSPGQFHDMDIVIRVPQRKRDKMTVLDQFLLEMHVLAWKKLKEEEEDVFLCSCQDLIISGSKRIPDDLHHFWGDEEPNNYLFALKIPEEKETMGPTRKWRTRSDSFHVIPTTQLPSEFAVSFPDFNCLKNYYNGQKLVIEYPLDLADKIIRVEPGKHGCSCVMVHRIQRYIRLGFQPIYPSPRTLLPSACDENGCRSGFRMKEHIQKEQLIEDNYYANELDRVLWENIDNLQKTTLLGT